jgi:chemotaxis protein MotA
MDGATLFGLVLALAAVLGGNALEGGSFSAVLQPTAALIVLGGTFGAVFVQFPASTLRRALADLKLAFRPRVRDHDATIRVLVRFAQKARREGLVALDRETGLLADPFMKRALEMAVDGTEARALRDALELELDRAEESGEQSAKVLEAGGGYAPTVGILGAVLGLIHVMQNLSDPSRLGSGIAVAFVATVYGVGLANLVFLPLAGKMKLRAREEIVRMELVLEGVCALAEGQSPHLVERKLEVYADERHAGATRTAAVVTARASA